jgi:hypothetical protein
MCGILRCNDCRRLHIDDRHRPALATRREKRKVLRYTGALLILTGVTALAIVAYFSLLPD